MISTLKRVSVHLLGPAEVSLDAAPARFATRKTLALLAYLAIEARPIARERLIALMWPDSDAAHGRSALRSTLAYLRTALGSSDVVVAHADMLHLVQVDLDLREVSSALAGGSLQELAAASQLIRGPLLDGLSLDDAPDFEQWLAGQREQWRLRTDRVFEQLLAQQPEVAVAERWYAIDPLNELSFRRLIETHLHVGDTQTAARAFAAGRARLERELDSPMHPDLLALAERLRLQAPRVAPAQLTGGWARFESAFVGREAEHVQLVRAYRLAVANGPRAISIEGEAGIGKTRLADEFLAWAAAESADVLRGRAFGLGDGPSQLPYAPIVQALRARLEAENAPDDLLPDVWLAELGRLLPELFDRYPDLPRVAAEAAVGSSHLLESVVRLVDALARRRPVVFMVDDAQWADAASLDLLRYAAQRWLSLHTRILVLLTVRDDARVVTLGALERELPVDRVLLGPLTAEDTLRWVASGDPRGQPFFVSETLKMLVHSGVLGEHLDFDSALRRETELRGVLPPSVREVVRARLARLSSPAAALVNAASVLGDAVTFEVLRRVADLDETVALGGLDDLLVSRLVRELPGDRYGFSHDKIRETVYADLSEARRRYLHRRALVALEALGTTPAAELATHARAADLAEPAFLHSVRAGSAALAVFAIRDAITHLEAARALLPAVVVDSSALEQLYTQLGRAHELAGDMPAARQVYEAMLAAARPRPAHSESHAATSDTAPAPSPASSEPRSRPHPPPGPDAHAATAIPVPAPSPPGADPLPRVPEPRDIPATASAGPAGHSATPEPLPPSRLASLECLALNRLATITAQADFNLPRALELLEEATSAAKRSEGALDKAETEWNLAQVHYYNRTLDHAREHAHTALDQARGLDRPDLIARALNISAYVHMDLGDLPSAANFAREARALYAQLGNRALEVDCLCQMASAEVCAGRYPAGIPYAREARAIAEQIGNTWSQVFSAYHLGLALADAGEFDEAASLFDEAVAKAPGKVSVLLEALCRNALGVVVRMRGDPAAALAIHMANLTASERATFVSIADVCVDLAALDRWPEAAEYAKLLADIPHGVMPAYARMHTLWIEVESLVRAGLPELAERTLQSFVAVAGDSPRYRVTSLRAQAALHRDSAFLDEANALAAEMKIHLPEPW